MSPMGRARVVHGIDRLQLPLRAGEGRRKMAESLFNPNQPHLCCPICHLWFFHDENLAYHVNNRHGLTTMQAEPFRFASIPESNRTHDWKPKPWVVHPPEGGRGKA